MANPLITGHVCIAGCGAVTALGAGLAPLQVALRENSSGLRKCTRLAGQGYAAEVAGMVPESIWDDLQARHPSDADSPAFLLADAAISQAGQSRGDLWRQTPPARRALVLSTTKAEITALERLVRGETVAPAVRRRILPGALAVDLAASHEIEGPVRCVSTACVSGLLALEVAARQLRAGEADLAMVAGVDLLSHFVLSGFTRLKALDPAGCRPFDQRRVGLSLGEGAGAILLAKAVEPGSPRLAITGWGASNDANHLTGPSRDGSGLALAISRALEQARLQPRDIDYVNAHGTGTLYNDAMEVLALRTVFGDLAPPFSSSKGLLGHTLGAAGILEVILCQLAVELGLMPGTPGLEQPDPLASGWVLPTPRPGSSPRRILKLNAGFGGTNAALVLVNFQEMD